MNKFTAVFCTGLITLWASNAMAETPGEQIHDGRIQQQEGLDKINKSHELRQEGKQNIKDGRELIKTDYKKDGKAAIKDGRKQIHDANQLHREGEKDVRRGTNNVYEGKKNIRDRDHE